MLATLGQIVTQAALVSGVIYLLLILGEQVFPQLYPYPVRLDHLALLFAVAFLPRMLTWLIGMAIDRYRGRKRRKT
jgi:hypothetical protein